MFGLKMVELFDWLVEDRRGQPALPADLPSALETFKSMEYGDTDDASWTEADIAGVCKYLRGGISLVVPPEWRPVLPKRL